MKWADLYLVPGQEKECIQILKCIVLYNIIHYKDGIVYMDQIDVQPKKSQQKEWVFQTDQDGELHFYETSKI